MLVKGVGANEMSVKEIPQDSVWLDPQTECLDGVNRNRTTPGDALNELVKLIVILELGIWWKKCGIFTVREIYCLVNLTLMYCVDFCCCFMCVILFERCLYCLHFYFFCLFAMCLLRVGELCPWIKLEV